MPTPLTRPRHVGRPMIYLSGTVDCKANTPGRIIVTSPERGKSALGGGEPALAQRMGGLGRIFELLAGRTLVCDPRS
jgi:hypothetical protein